MDFTYLIYVHFIRNEKCNLLFSCLQMQKVNTPPFFTSDIIKIIFNLVLMSPLNLFTFHTHICQKNKTLRKFFYRYRGEVRR